MGSQAWAHEGEPPRLEYVYLVERRQTEYPFHTLCIYGVYESKNKATGIKNKLNKEYKKWNDTSKIAEIKKRKVE
jgi:hypothetical protein